jgi:excinuclease UvrABC nuclease subunit
VYILANRQGKVLKIGQTSNMFNRIYTQYKCITNTTNARIRNYIKEVEDITVYVYLTPKHKSTVLGHTVYTSYAMGLEHELLKEYKQVTKSLPKLNTMIR